MSLPEPTTLPPRADFMPPMRLFAIADDTPDGAWRAQLAALAAHLDAARFSLTTTVLRGDAGSTVEESGWSNGPRIANRESRIPSPALVPRSDRWTIDPRAVWQLRRLLREASPDVVLTVGEIAAVDGRLAAALCGARRIVACWPSVDFDFLSGGAALMSRWLLRHTEKVVLASTAEHDAAVTHGWPPDRVVVAPMAVAPLTKTLSRDAVFGRLSIPASSAVVAVAAPWSPRHRVKEAIWAFDLLRAVRRDARMIVCGEGPERADLEAFRDSQECRHAIHFVGPHELPEEWLAHADVLWSLDPGPRVAYATQRAAASGVPVVAVDTPPHRAFVVPNATGLLIPGAVRPAPTQATLRLLDDDALRQTLSQGSAQWFRDRHAPAATATALAAILG